MYQELYKSVPPSPALLEKIIRSKDAVRKGKALPSMATADLLDKDTLHAILARPVKTRAHTLIRVQKELAPIIGNRKALVLLVDFSDKPASESKKHYEDMLFSSNTYQGGSLRDYYYEASYKKLNITGEVFGNGVTVGWFRAPKPYSYYTDNNFGTDSPYPKNAQKLVEDIVDMAASSVNFASYDNDGDKIVDALFVVHAGPGAEATGQKGDIWSHQWEINPKKYNGVTISSYSIEPEDGNIGVFCHELGHVFGLPDLYDYGYDSSGTGDWDLMAGGSWNDGGRTPSHMLAWCKLKLGWINPTVIFNNSQNVTIKPSANYDQVYMLPVGSQSSKEYFLLENRKKIGFDRFLPGEGLLITHVDESQSNNNDQTHYLVDIEQADGKMELNKNANQGDPNDPYPIAGNNSFSASTTPSSKSYSGSDSKVSVTGIERAGDNIVAAINVGGVVADEAKWYNNVKITSTYAYYTSQWAWAYVQGVGWRRIKDGSPDAVTNMFTLCCQALANKRPVKVYADANFIYTAYLL